MTSPSHRKSAGPQPVQVSVQAVKQADASTGVDAAEPGPVGAPAGSQLPVRQAVPLMTEPLRPDPFRHQAGLIADAFGIRTAIWAVAALTAASGLVVAVRMYETRSAAPTRVAVR